MKALPVALALPLLGLLAGAGRGAPRKEVCAPLRLSETGLYDRSGGIAPGLRAFSPQYPLWSDGALKSRWILLPSGTRVDVRDGDAWDFPVGTKFWKEFRIGGRKAETRFLWRASATQWVYASYAWRADQADADLAPAAGLASVADLGNGKAHCIPSVADCRACHENGGPPVLGFNALQLSDDRDPNAPHAEALQPGMLTLSAMSAQGLLNPPRPEWTARPPRIPAADPTTRAALGYLAANCGNCHRASGADTALHTVDLAFNHRLAAARPEEEPGWSTTVVKPGKYAIPGDAASNLRVAPGAPERSTLVHRMASRRPSSQMPPLGSVVADEAGLALMRTWIGGMGAEGPECLHSGILPEYPMTLRRAALACALLAPLSAADNGATGRIGPVQGRASTAAFFVAIPEQLPKMPEKPVYMIRFNLADTHVQLGFFPSGRIYVLRAEPGDDRWIPVKEFDHVDIHVLAPGQKGEDAAALLKAPPKASGALKPGERYLVHLKGTLKGVGPLMGQTQDMDVWAWGQLAAQEAPL